MNSRNAPCRNCSERQPGCQTDACPRWKEWHGKEMERKTLIYKRRWLENALRKVGKKRPGENHTARILQGKSHKKERPHGSRMEMEKAESGRIREEVRKREVGD